MTVTLPGPLLFACAVLGLPAVFVLGEARHVLRARRRDRKTPVPGNATPSPAVAAPPLAPPARRQPPAPARIHPKHGAKLLSADFYEDGTVLVHDHLRHKTTSFEAPEVDPCIDWDDWLKGLTS